MARDEPPYQILLVEDEPGEAVLIQRLLQSNCPDCFQVVWAPTLKEARQMTARDVPFDVFVLDIGLPDSIGQETVHTGLRLAGKKPVIILSGRDDAETIQLARILGVTDYVVKGGYDASTLINTLRRVLGCPDGGFAKPADA